MNAKGDCAIRNHSHDHIAIVMPDFDDACRDWIQVGINLSIFLFSEFLFFLLIKRNGEHPWRRFLQRGANFLLQGETTVFRVSEVSNFCFSFSIFFPLYFNPPKHLKPKLKMSQLSPLLSVGVCAIWFVRFIADFKFWKWNFSKLCAAAISIIRLQCETVRSDWNLQSGSENSVSFIGLDCAEFV